MKRLVLLLLLLSQSAWAATTFDESSDNGGAAGAASTSWTHDGGSGPGLAMAACAFGSTSRTFSTVTFGGVSMTQVSGSPFTGSGGGYGLVVYYLKLPPTGNQTVAFTASGTTNLACGAITFSSVDQTTTFGTSGNEQDTDGSSSIALTSTTSDMCVEFLMNGFQTITLTGGQTNRQSVSAGAEIRLQINTSAASNPTMSSTFTADFHNAYAVPVLQFAGGGRFLISQRRRR